MALHLGPLGTDTTTTIDILCRCFASPPERVARWLEAAGHENVRVLRRGHKPIACLLLVPMGQYFGGSSIPMTGIAGVGVPPELRGKGAALALMTAAVREISDSGAALSTLYPAATGLYRKAGYEVAGARYEVDLDNHRLALDPAFLPSSKPRKSDEPEIRPFRDRDRIAVRTLYRQLAAEQNGALDRGRYIWGRIEFPSIGPTSQGYVVDRKGVVEGYVFFKQVPTTDGMYRIDVSDLVARDLPAARRLLAFLSTMRSMGPTTKIHTASVANLVTMLAEPHIDARLSLAWMTRICNVHSALEKRGYPAGLAATLELEVSDPHLTRNHGRFTLSKENGNARVRKGGRGRIALDVRALAALYTGYLSAEQLGRMGQIKASERDAALASAAFGGGAPGMRDMF